MQFLKIIPLDDKFKLSSHGQTNDPSQLSLPKYPQSIQFPHPMIITATVKIPTYTTPWPLGDELVSWSTVSCKFASKGVLFLKLVQTALNLATHKYQYKQGHP